MPDVKFKKGDIPWNKNTKGIMKLNKGSFKKGQSAPKHKEDCKCFRCTGISPRKGKKCSEYAKEKIKQANIGKTPWNKGLTKETSLIVSNISIKTKKKLMGVKHSKIRNETNRNAQIKRVEKYRLNGLPLFPCIGNHEKVILDNIEKNIYPYKIIRQCKVAGYFIDGYASDLNLAIEVDEPHHDPIKDNIRQTNIEEKINCKFLRIPTRWI